MHKIIYFSLLVSLTLNSMERQLSTNKFTSFCDLPQEIRINVLDLAIDKFNDSDVMFNHQVILKQRKKAALTTVRSLLLTNKLCAQQCKISFASHQYNFINRITEWIKYNNSNRKAIKPVTIINALNNEQLFDYFIKYYLECYRFIPEGYTKLCNEFDLKEIGAYDPKVFPYTSGPIKEPLSSAINRLKLPFRKKLYHFLMKSFSHYYNLTDPYYINTEKD